MAQFFDTAQKKDDQGRITQEAKQGIFSAVGNALVLTATGIQDPSQLLKIEASRKAAEAQAEKERQQQEFQNAIMSQLGVNINNAGKMEPRTISAGSSIGQPKIDTPDRAMNRFVDGIPVTKFELDVGKAGFKQSKESEIEQSLFEKEATSQIDLSKGVSESAIKEMQEKYGQAGRVVQAFRNLEGFGKSLDDTAMSPATKQLMAKFEGVIPFLPEKTQEELIPLQNFIAQQQEVKISLLPILSGQARYVVDLAQAISKTVPKPGSATENRQNLIAQSVRNSMSLVFAVENGQLNAQKLKDLGIDPNSEVGKVEGGKLPNAAQELLNSITLSEDQEKAIEQAIDDVTGTGKIRKGKLEDRGFKSTSSGIKYRVIGE